MALACSNWPCWKLLVGRMPTELVKASVEAVPRPRRARAVAGDALMSCIDLKTSSEKAAGSATWTAPLPRTAIALRFLAPTAAPTPERPAARDLSLITQAERTRVSPALPLPEVRGC